MTNLHYAIASSSIQRDLNNSDISRIEKNIPADIWKVINNADTHEEIVNAYDLITEWIDSNLTFVNNLLK